MITGCFSGTCLIIKCASLFFDSKYVVFHKLSKTYSFAYVNICFAKVYVFAYAKVYTVHKTYSFAYTKYIVLQMYMVFMVLHAALFTVDSGGLYSGRLFFRATSRKGAPNMSYST